MVPAHTAKCTQAVPDLEAQMSKPVDLSQRRYGRLVALHSDGETAYGHTRWACICDCGTRCHANVNQLNRGTKKSCGCLKRETKSNLIHGQAMSREFAIWSGMLSRCYNPRRACYPGYGGRGVAVCDRWRFGEGGKNGFECFFEDMGRSPSAKHSVDRVNCNGNYEPGNVRWATQLEQVNNRRQTRIVFYNGQHMALTDAVRLAGSIIHYQSAANRIFRSGWDVDVALSTPSTRYQKVRA
jgi:hypothetical protein